MSFDLAIADRENRRSNELVPDSLMRPLFNVVRFELTQRSVKCGRSEKDESVEAFFFH